MMRNAIRPVAMAIAISLCTPVLAQTTETVATHSDWAVVVAGEPKECYIVSQPTKSVARRGGSTVDVRRGDIRLFVSFRPNENIANEISFTGGYPFKPGQAVKLEIGGRDFNMSPGTGAGAEWAWTSVSDDATAVAALRAGATATVTGVSSRGTTTIDDFSLIGFTAAVTDAEARCK